MITCHRVFLEARCRERGYTLDEVMPCVVEQRGNRWTIDVDHPAYPRTAKEIPPGVGTKLKGLLSMVGIKASENCSCNQRARAMDERGVEWCEENKETIVGWLREEAGKRKLPFIDAAGYLLVNRAIKLAKRDSKK